MANTRIKEIREKERAIARRLEISNAKNLKNAKKGKNYTTQYIKGAREGFSRSDYGAGEAGAAIPYQVGTKTQKKTSRPTRPPISVEPGKPTTPGWGKVINGSADNSWSVPGVRNNAIKRRLGG